MGTYPCRAVHGPPGRGYGIGGVCNTRRGAAAPHRVQAGNSEHYGLAPHLFAAAVHHDAQRCNDDVFCCAAAGVWSAWIRRAALLRCSRHCVPVGRCICPWLTARARCMQMQVKHLPSPAPAHKEARFPGLGEQAGRYCKVPAGRRAAAAAHRCCRARLPESTYDRFLLRMLGACSSSTHRLSRRHAEGGLGRAGAGTLMDAWRAPRIPVSSTVWRCASSASAVASAIFCYHQRWRPCQSMLAMCVETMDSVISFLDSVISFLDSTCTSYLAGSRVL